MPDQVSALPPDLLAQLPAAQVAAAIALLARLLAEAVPTTQRAVAGDE